jgi:hypothetical protein
MTRRALVRAPEPLAGLRVVASPETLDAMEWATGVAPLRLAADDLLAVGAVTAEVGYAPAIVEGETGFVGWWLTPDEVTETVLPHIDWPLPLERPSLAQGLVAGVPAKLWVSDERALLLCAAAYSHELEERLP